MVGHDGAGDLATMKMTAGGRAFCFLGRTWSSDAGHQWPGVAKTGDARCASRRQILVADLVRAHGNKVMLARRGRTCARTTKI